MTPREFYVQHRQAELPLFMDVLKAPPESDLDYKPAARYARLRRADSHTFSRITPKACAPSSTPEACVPLAN